MISNTNFKLYPTFTKAVQSLTQLLFLHYHNVFLGPPTFKRARSFSQNSQTPADHSESPTNLVKTRFAAVCDSLAPAPELSRARTEQQRWNETVQI